MVSSPKFINNSARSLKLAMSSKNANKDLSECKIFDEHKTNNSIVTADAALDSVNKLYTLINSIKTGEQQAKTA